MTEHKEAALSKNLVTHLEPSSPSAEAYRTLRTNIHYSSIDKKIKSIVITSPSVQDGKTVTACNLAVSMANAGKKVLLIDADLRKPSIHKQFKIMNYKGLTNILVDECDPERVLHQPNEVPNLRILTCGDIPPNPSELLASSRIKELIGRFSGEYDKIIIDTPPVGFVSDGIILAREADGVILIISKSQTRITFASLAVGALRKVNANILGVVLTKDKMKECDRYYEYR